MSATNMPVSFTQELNLNRMTIIKTSRPRSERIRPTSKLTLTKTRLGSLVKTKSLKQTRSYSRLTKLERSTRLWMLLSAPGEKPRRRLNTSISQSHLKMRPSTEAHFQLLMDVLQPTAQPSEKVRLSRDARAPLCHQHLDKLQLKMLPQSHLR